MFLLGQDVRPDRPPHGRIWTADGHIDLSHGRRWTTGRMDELRGGLGRTDDGPGIRGLQ